MSFANSPFPPSSLQTRLKPRYRPSALASDRPPACPIPTASVKRRHQDGVAQAVLRNSPIMLAIAAALCARMLDRSLVFGRNYATNCPFVRDSEAVQTPHSQRPRTFIPTGIGLRKQTPEAAIVRHSLNDVRYPATCRIPLQWNVPGPQPRHAATSGSTERYPSGDPHRKPVRAAKMVMP